MKWIFQFDVFHFYFGSSLLPLSLDLPLLRLMGKRVIMTYCGSEARLIFLERQRNPYWYLVDKELKGTLDDEKHDWKKVLMLRWHGLWCHQIIAPRNLYASVSKYVETKKIVKDIWVHNLSFSANAAQTLNQCDSKTDSKDIVRIVHMPSSPVVKGTRFFRDAISQLKKEGFVFEYIEVMNMEHSQAIGELKKADIVLDQLLIGGFGSLAVEAMGFGKPVVCYLIETAKKEHYEDCPIVIASIDTVKEKIAELILDKNLRKRIGHAGKLFVARHFDYEKVNEAIMELYQ